MTQSYDLVAQVRSEVRNFLDESITITSIPGEDNQSYVNGGRIPGQHGGVKAGH